MIDLRISSKLISQYLRQNSYRLLLPQNNINKCSIAHYSINNYRKNESNSSVFCFSKQLSLKDIHGTTTLPLYTNIQKRNITDEVLLSKLSPDAKPMPDAVVKGFNSSLKSNAAEVHQIFSMPDSFIEIADGSIVQLVQDFILQIHKDFGTPWWGTIVLTAVIMRTSFVLPFAINEVRNMVKLRKIDHYMTKYKKRMREEAQEYKLHYGWPEEFASEHYAKKVNNELRCQYKEEKCHPKGFYYLATVQSLSWFMTSLAFWNLCNIRPRSEDAMNIYLELVSGGFGWVNDLTECDPYMILPIAISVVNLATLGAHRLFINERDDFKIQRQHIVLHIINMSLFPISICSPAAVNIYWLSSSLYGLVQVFVLYSPFVQRLFRFPIVDPKQGHRFYYNLMKSRLTFKEK